MVADSGTQQFEEVASAYNATILTRLLRERLGFTGVINTDSGVLGTNAFGVEALALPQRFAKAVKAGVNIFSDNNNPQGLIDAVKQRLLTEHDLNPSVTRLLTELFHLGLFENPYTDPDKAQALANSAVSAARADEAHRKSVVLLRNDQQVLPLTGTRRVYVEIFAEPAAGGGAREAQRDRERTRRAGGRRLEGRRRKPGHAVAGPAAPGRKPTGGPPASGRPPA